jgi:MOSC domain-containing protein YiiM
MFEHPRIFQISISKGGVPKRAVHAADIVSDGIVGDKQRDRRFHGGPTRALCIYSVEQIVQLQSEGHTIHPGSTGENITTVGLDLAAVLPGDRFALGEEVVIEVLSYASPCKNIRESFRDEEIGRISQKIHPGWSRMYASVIRDGRISTGDPITPLGRDAGAP